VEMERKEKLQLILMILFLVVLVITIGYMVFNKPKEVVNPKVTMKIKDKGNIVIELYPDKAPNTVANFMNLVSSRIL
jgi:peptidyl-prolyl cis-trans isomerase